eukprot:CFRG6996T1
MADQNNIEGEGMMDLNTHPDDSLPLDPLDDEADGLGGHHGGDAEGGLPLGPGFPEVGVDVDVAQGGGQSHEQMQYEMHMQQQQQQQQQQFEQQLQAQSLHQQQLQSNQIHHQQHQQLDAQTQAQQQAEAQTHAQAMSLAHSHAHAQNEAAQHVQQAAQQQQQHHQLRQQHEHDQQYQIHVQDQGTSQHSQQQHEQHLHLEEDQLHVHTHTQLGIDDTHQLGDGVQQQQHLDHQMHHQIGVNEHHQHPLQDEQQQQQQQHHHHQQQQQQQQLDVGLHYDNSQLDEETQSSVEEQAKKNRARNLHHFGLPEPVAPGHAHQHSHPHQHTHSHASEDALSAPGQSMGYMAGLATGSSALVQPSLGDHMLHQNDGLDAHAHAHTQHQQQAHSTALGMYDDGTHSGDLVENLDGPGSQHHAQQPDAQQGGLEGEIPDESELMQLSGHDQMNIVPALPPKPKIPKKKYVSLSMAQKQALIADAEAQGFVVGNDISKQMCNQQELSRKYNVSSKTVFRALNSASSIISRSSTGKGASKRQRRGKWPKLDAYMAAWVTERRTKQPVVRISLNNIQNEASEYARLNGIDKFSASHGWVEGFKTRMGMKDLFSADPQPYPQIEPASPLDTQGHIDHHQLTIMAAPGAGAGSMVHAQPPLNGHVDDSHDNTHQHHEHSLSINGKSLQGVNMQTMPSVHQHVGVSVGVDLGVGGVQVNTQHTQQTHMLQNLSSEGSLTANSNPNSQQHHDVDHQQQHQQHQHQHQGAEHTQQEFQQTHHQNYDAFNELQQRQESIHQQVQQNGDVGMGGDVDEQLANTHPHDDNIGVGVGEDVNVRDLNGFDVVPADSEQSHVDAPNHPMLGGNFSSNDGSLGDTVGNLSGTLDEV